MLHYDDRIITAALSYFGFLSRCTMAASVLNTVAFMSYKKTTWSCLILLETRTYNYTELPQSNITRYIRVRRTYSEVRILQFQDINQFFDKASVQDRIEMFLGRVGVNYSNSFHTISLSSFSQLLNTQTN